MKILHCCLSCFYIDDYNYQENILPRIHKQNGNDVLIIASTETYIDNQRLGYVKPKAYLTNDNIVIHRIPYKKYFPRFLMKKIRDYRGTLKIIEAFKPDIIMFHGVPAFELLKIAKYKKEHRNVKLYVDSHEDKNNSGTNFFSKYFFHKLFYRWIVSKSIKFIDKILYLSAESKDFLIDFYKIPERILEFYPLGGIVIDRATKSAQREEIRSLLGISPDDILFCHSGKMDEKKKTIEIIKNFVKTSNNKFKLIIIGTFTSDVSSNVMPLIQSDKRVQFLGWKKSEELLKYIAGSDLYLQPGGQSATMQNALCVGTPVLFENVKSHQFYMRGNAFAINHSDEMANIFEEINRNPSILKKMSEKSFAFAEEFLDYEKLAHRLLL